MTDKSNTRNWQAIKAAKRICWISLSTIHQSPYQNDRQIQNNFVHCACWLFCFLNFARQRKRWTPPKTLVYQCHCAFDKVTRGSTRWSKGACQAWGGKLRLSKLLAQSIFERLDCKAFQLVFLKSKHSRLAGIKKERQISSYSSLIFPKTPGAMAQGIWEATSQATRPER